MKIALITGASRGLGLALARQRTANGWGLVIDARGKKALQQAYEELSAETRVIAIAGDITAESHRKKLAKAADELGGTRRFDQQRKCFGTQALNRNYWNIRWMCSSRCTPPTLSPRLR